MYLLTTSMRYKHFYHHCVLCRYMHSMCSMQTHPSVGIHHKERMPPFEMSEFHYDSETMSLLSR